MSIPMLITLAFFGGVILQILFRYKSISVAVPTIVLSLWVLFAVFFQPYKGGGASMWPIALFFVVIYSAGAALVGMLLVVIITKIKKSK